MEIILTLFNNKPFLVFPTNPFAWLGLLGLAVVIAILIVDWYRQSIYRSEESKSSQVIEIRAGKGEPIFLRKGIVFGVLFVLSVFLVMQLGVVLLSDDILPLPYLALNPSELVVMLFASLPWMLAAGLLGTPQAVAIGIWSGFLLSLWGTHNPYTIFEFGIVAAIFSAAINQRYRTRIFWLLRQPFFAVFVIGFLIYPIIHFFDNVLFSNGSLAVRLDYAFSYIKWSLVIVNAPLFVGAAVASLLKYFFPTFWGGQPPWLIAPMEKRLSTRYFRSLFPVYLVVIVGFIYLGWTISILRAQNLVKSMVQNTVELTGENIPFFLDTGQSLIRSIAMDDLTVDDIPLLQSQLEENIGAAPFFGELLIVSADNTVITEFPPTDRYPYLHPDESTGVHLALSGVPIQVYSIVPMEDSTTSQVSFIATIYSQDSLPVGVIIGRTDLTYNPYIQPIIKNLQTLDEIDGQGYVIDDTGKIIYHTSQSVLRNQITGDMGSEPGFYYDRAPDGTRNLVYQYPSKGKPWTVVAEVPASSYQAIALQTSIPILAVVAVISAVLGLFVNSQLKNVTQSIVLLAKESERIADGDLETAFTIQSEDEVGLLSRSFEDMRISLKNRVEELNLLLLVSRGISSTLEIGEMVQPILEAALTTGASSARLIFTQEALPTASIINKIQTRFGAGLATEQFSYLDYQVLQLNRERETIVISNPLRTPMLKFGLGSKPPGTILAFAIKDEDTFFGTLWLAYDTQHKVSEEDLSFLKALTGHAVLAASNARLYLNAELGRQRLAGILASSPDPVLVTDHRGTILDLNPAAMITFGIILDHNQTYMIEDVINDSTLIRLLKSTDNTEETVEVSLAGDQTFMATRSPIQVSGQQVGYVCTLRDVTYFKQLDAIKTEFVSTVSHDLRKPLTLMKGYATMLEMVGELNDQQTQYVRKIITGVEGMSGLVSDLLDLGRIEAGVGLRLDAVPVHDVIRRVIQELQPLANQKKIVLTMEASTGTIPLLEADKTLLQQAFKNLLDNAIKFTNQDGSIWIRYYVSDERIVVEFEDTGVGISPVDQKQLFSRFFRSTSRDVRKERGSGLGLSIVKSIAERHGGSVWVESQLGRGSTFYFAIPLRQQTF